MMKIGLRVPAFGWRATPDQIEVHARAAEEYGFDSIWVSDHVVMPREHTSMHAAPFKVDEAFLEPIMLLSYLAALTERVELGVSVLVLPMRQPVLHAKLLATLDHLAEGRLILGGGVGWAREEFEVLSMPWDRRGRRTDEILQLYRAFWTGEPVNFHGEFYQVDGWTSRPVPPRRVPIWMGGNSPQQFRRAARWGDGWISRGAEAADLPRNIEQLHAAAEAENRNPEELTVAIHSHVWITKDGMAEAADQLVILREAGVQHALVTIDLRETEQVTELIERFGSDHLTALQQK
jgi:probable F420-dependent oxidoreductase